MKIKVNNLNMTLLTGLLVGLFVAIVGCSVASATPSQTIPSTPTTQTNQPTANPATADASKTVPSTISVVVVGTITHGPMQPTIRSIKDVLSKYGDKVSVTWFDMSTKEGYKYATDHKLDAHMNIVINGTFKYQVNGKNVEFQWFEGDQWTRQDLDAVLANLVNK
jgi:hypothetical protein